LATAGSRSRSTKRRREKHYHPHLDDNGPSWLTFIGHTKDSLWSLDLFHCESILLNTHWVLVVMDQFTRRIIGFGVHAGDVDVVALVRSCTTTTSTVFISLWMGTRPMKLAVTTNRYMQNLTTIHGYHIATDFFRRQLLHE